MKNKRESSKQYSIRKKVDEAILELNNMPNANPPQDAIHLLHELQVHQIELEMQNDELKRAQEEVEASAVRYLELYDFAPVGYFTLTKELSILQVNFAGARLVRSDRSNLIGAMFALFIAEEHRLTFNKYMHDLFNQGAIQSLDTVLKVDNEPPIYVQISASVTENQNQCLFAVLDISQRMQHEAILRETHLREMKLNTEKDTLFSIIAHDLRGPMNGLLGLTQILATESNDLTSEDIIEYSTEMHHAVQNLYKLLENLLEWSVFQRGLTDFTQTELNLYTLISECIQSSSTASQHKSIQVFNEVNPDQMVFADKKMLLTILRNLLSNAIKFTRRQGSITLRSRALESGMLEVSVTDTGVGMSADKVLKLFTIGAKTGSIGTEDEPSTGLGLILCKEFTEVHGGKIWAVSVPEDLDAGVSGSSTFYFTLPIKQFSSL